MDLLINLFICIYCVYLKKRQTFYPKIVSWLLRFKRIVNLIQLKKTIDSYFAIDF